MSTRERPVRDAGMVIDRPMMMAAAANIVGLLALLALPILRVVGPDNERHNQSRSDVAETLDFLGGFGEYAVTLPIFTFLLAAVIALLPMVIPYRRIIVAVLSLLGLYQIIGLMVTNNQNDLGLGMDDLGIGTWIVILASIAGGAIAMGMRDR